MAIFISIIFYASGWTYLLLSILRRINLHRGVLYGLIIAGVVAQAIPAINSLHSPSGFRFDLFQVISILFVVINILVCISSLKKPIENLFILLIPLTIIAILCSTLFDSDAETMTQISFPIITHVLLSVFAHSLLAIATLQALLLMYQYKKLKTKHPRGLIGILPPFQTMETLMFELVWAGIILLSFSILSGLIFLDNMFAQHLVHKTVFSILAWIIYATLLWGRHSVGWRGLIAIRWVLVGFAALMLSYFGSKFVLEVILTP